jgi:hypothetical protein
MMTKDRLHLIDVLKFTALIAIAVLHSNEFVFYTHDFPLGMKSPIFYCTLNYYARFFVISGQTLVATIYFLFGYTGKSKKALLLTSLFAFIGQMILTFIFQTVEWDIYAFIAACNILIVCIPFFFRKNIFIVVASFLMLLIPTFLFKENTPDSSFFAVLTGKMTDDNTGSWPMLPWFFFSLLFYQLGLISKNNEALKTIKPFEKIMWPLIALVSLPVMLKYYPVPIGEYYYDYSFNQLPHIFWGNFWIFVLGIRLSLVTSVQDRIRDNRIIQWISRLYWMRHLGLTYLLSVIYLGIGMQFRDVFYKDPILFDVFFVFLMPVPELFSRLIIYLVQKFKR